MDTELDWFDAAVEKAIEDGDYEAAVMLLEHAEEKIGDHNGND
jgi:hypothetical protein